MHPIMTGPKIIIWHSYYKKKIELKESKKSKFVLNKIGCIITSKRAANGEETKDNNKEVLL